MSSNHEVSDRTNDSEEVYVIDSLDKLIHYLGAVALSVPEAVVKILQRR